MKKSKIIVTTMVLSILTTGISSEIVQTEAADRTQVETASTSASHLIPYTITVDGVTSFIEANFEFDNRKLTNYQEINEKVKSILQSQRGMTLTKLQKNLRAEYMVTFKNNAKKKINLKSTAINSNLLAVNEIKQIDIVVHTSDYDELKLKKRKAQKYINRFAPKYKASVFAHIRYEVEHEIKLLKKDFSLSKVEKIKSLIAMLPSKESEVYTPPLEKIVQRNAPIPY